MDIDVEAQIQRGERQELQVAEGGGLEQQRQVYGMYELAATELTLLLYFQFYAYVRLEMISVLMFCEIDRLAMRIKFPHARAS